METMKMCQHDNFMLQKKKETYIVKNEPITIEAQVPVCRQCGEEIFVSEIDDNNLTKAYDIYRQKHNLLSARNIVKLRSKYQLSQRAFAALIGCTQATINRYEKGAIPDSAYNSLIQLMEDPKNVETMLEYHHSEMDVKDVDKLAKILKKIMHKDNCSDSVFSTLSQIMSTQIDEFSGFKNFDINKVIAMIVFFAIHQDCLYKTKLMKLLWYADMLAFKKLVQSISGMRYVHQRFGPVPENYDFLLSVLQKAGYIKLISDEETSGEMVITKMVYNIEYLSEEEIKVINIVNDHFKNQSATQISAISHKEYGYAKTKRLQPISYAYASQLREL